jgi:hypothetical protein
MKHGFSWLDDRRRWAPLEKIFKALPGHYDRYRRVVDEAPYAYNERAQVSHLVQAAVKAGYVCMEEYSLTYDEDDPQGADRSSFRPDVYIAANRPGEDFDDLVIEAKRDAIPITRSVENLTKSIEKRLEAALEQVETGWSCKGQAHRLSAMLFMPVYIAPTKWEHFETESYSRAIDEAIGRFDKAVRACRTCKPSFAFHFFNEKTVAKKLTNEDMPVYPGVFVCGTLGGFDRERQRGLDS